MATNPVQLDFTKAVPLDTPAQPESDSSNSVTLDFSKAQPVNAGPSTPAQPSQPASTDNDGVLEQTGEAIGNTVIGAGKSALNTVAGTDEWARKHLPAFFTNSNFGIGPPADLERQKEWTTTHGTAQSVGAGVETLGEFLLGDEALKGLALSERFVRASKAAKVIEESPLLTRVVNAGVRALRGATVGGTQAGLKTDDANDAATAAVAGGVGNAVIPEALDAVQAARKALPGALDTIRTVIKPGTIQDAFQRQIRELVNAAAQDHGVSPSSASSIRDVAQQVSDNLLSKAKAAYQAMDEASGGRVQRTSDAIKNVQKKIRDLNGIDPDAEGAFIEKLNELQDAHEKIMTEMEEAGVPRDLLNEANSTYRKAKSMLDLNRAIRASSEGLRPELANGLKTPIPEKVNTGKLISRVNKLYDSGRLQDALGQRAQDLVRAVNDSHVATQLAESWRGLVKKYGGYAAAGALPFGGYELVRHLLGE
jgi:hypothetical protein